LIRDGSSGQMAYVVLDESPSVLMDLAQGPGPWLSKIPRSAVVKLSSNGVVSSDTRIGQASLEVTSKEEFGVNQSMVILVKVTISLFYLIY